MTVPVDFTLSAPQGQIAKAAIDSRRFARPAIPFVDARTAFKAFMLAFRFSSEDEVLLPAYVGWSARRDWSLRSGSGDRRQVPVLRHDRPTRDRY